MRGLLSGLIVVAMVCPLYAGVILQEDFSTGTVGNDVAGWNGWTGDAGIGISATVIDAGNSATLANGSWLGINKAFNYTPSAGEKYELSGILFANGFTGYADLGLRGSLTNVWPRVVAHLHTGTLSYSEGGTADATFAQVTGIDMTKAVDVKMVIPDIGGDLEAYWRYHGDTTWNVATPQGSEADRKADTALSGYAYVRSSVDGAGAGVDSIMFSAVPEPGTLALMASGGLVALQRRSRKS